MQLSNQPHFRAHDHFLPQQLVAIGIFAAFIQNDTLELFERNTVNDDDINTATHALAKVCYYLLREGDASKELEIIAVLEEINKTLLNDILDADENNYSGGQMAPAMSLLELVICADTDELVAANYGDSRVADLYKAAIAHATKLNQKVS